MYNNYKLIKFFQFKIMKCKKVQENNSDFLRLFLHATLECYDQLNKLTNCNVSQLNLLLVSVLLLKFFFLFLSLCKSWNSLLRFQQVQEILLMWKASGILMPANLIWINPILANSALVKEKRDKKRFHRSTRRNKSSSSAFARFAARASWLGGSTTNSPWQFIPPRNPREAKYAKSFMGIARIQYPKVRAAAKFN